MSLKEQKPQKTIPNSLKFFFGGSAGMLATLFVQPLDLVKNRMQLSKTKEYKTSFDAFRGIVAKEGFFALYNGISAGLLRQATYTTTRLGIYTWLLEQMKSADGTPPGFAAKAVGGMISGVCGAFVGTPAEVALIRMTADGRLPLNERRNYNNVFNALFRIYREEGLFTLWRGAVPTMGRAMVVNAAQLASYSQAKQLLVQYANLSEGIFLHFVASMISGLITTAASMPVDIAKTRIQNMKTIDGKPEYRGPIHVLASVIRNEGLFALWKGFSPYYFRLGPHTVLTFIFLEQMNAAYTKIQAMKKTEGQPEYTGPINVLTSIVRKEGIFALWKGFAPYYFRLGPHTVLTFVLLEQINAAYYKFVLGQPMTKGGL